MAVVGTVKHKNEGVEGFGYDVWDTVPEWKWEKVHRGQPWSNNHRMKDARTKRRQRSKLHYTPRYQPIDILDNIHPIVKDIGLHLLKGLL